LQVDHSASTGDNPGLGIIGVQMVARRAAGTEITSQVIPFLLGANMLGPNFRGGVCGYLGAALLALTFAGCGGSDRPPMGKVSGVVTLDGVPVPNASVMFIPAAGGRPASGITDASGHFQLKTFEKDDGALLGEHKVTVTCVETTGFQETADGLSGGVSPEGIKQTWITPQKYSLPETSGLTQTVEKRNPEVKLELTSK
jgi:hypothetical protein